MSENISALLATPTPRAWLSQEKPNKRFDTVDALTGALGEAALAGTLTARLNPLSFQGFPEALRPPLAQHFDLQTQRERGAWFLPEHARVSAMELNLPWALRDSPHFGFAAVERDSGTTSLTTPDALFVWGVLEPLMQRLMEPLLVRGPQAAGLQPGEIIRILHGAAEFLSDLGLDGDALLQPLSYGAGWAKLGREARAEQHLTYLAALTQGLRTGPASPDSHWASRYRTVRVRELVEKYAQKTKKGPPKREQVITKALGRTLSAYFGGDWLALLAYLDAAPHPDEAIVTALPEARLHVAVPGRAAVVAAELGVDPEALQHLLGTVWNNAGVQSPVEERTTVLRAFWDVFDDRHARQRPGDPSLWGLVSEGSTLRIDSTRDNLYRPDLAEQALGEELNRTIRRLWGTRAAPKAPEIIIDSPSPHHTMALACGPGLSFWNSVALTAWFICEGPYSRTDMQNLAHHQRKVLATLDAQGTPVPQALFDELIALEARLTPQPEPPRSSGLTVQFIEVKKDGFEPMRDAITRHRRAWADRYLDASLRAQWEEPLRALAREYSLVHAARRKAPTFKAFTKLGLPVADRWFAGNFEQVYAAIGEKCPVTVTDRSGMMGQGSVLQEVYDALCRVHGVKPVVDVRDISDPESQRRYAVAELAKEALPFLEFRATLGRNPTPEDLGWSRRPPRLDSLYPGEAQALAALARVVEEITVPGGTALAIAPPQRLADPARITEYEGVCEEGGKKPQGLGALLHKLFKN